MAVVELVSSNNGQFKAAPPPPPGGTGMDIDVKLAKLETRLDATLPTLATRHDVAEAKSNVVMWVAGVAIASTTSIVSVMAFMLNKITPPPASAPTPVIVYQTPPPANQSEPPQKIPGRQ